MYEFIEFTELFSYIVYKHQIQLNVDGVIKVPSLEEIRRASNIIMSRKYLNLFKHDDILLRNVYAKFIVDKREILLIDDFDCVKDYDISYHSRIRFIKRLYMFGMKDVETSKAFKTLFNIHMDSIVTIIKNKDWFNQIVNDLFIYFLKKIKVLKQIPTSLKKRNKKYMNRKEIHFYISNPFLFVIANDMTIITVEIRHIMMNSEEINKISSSNESFATFFRKQGRQFKLNPTFNSKSKERIESNCSE